MDLLIACQYYWPEDNATAVLLRDLSAGLVSRGWNVEVITAHPSYRGFAEAPSVEVQDGVSIRRIRSLQLGRSSASRRALTTMSFTAGLGRALVRRQPSPSLVLFVTCPPQSPWCGPLLRTFKGSPYAILIHDLYPEIAEATGHLKVNGPPAQIWRALNRHSFQRAAAVITLGSHMRETVLRHYPRILPERVVPIHNWITLPPSPPDPREVRELRRHRGGNAQLILQMSGNLGLFQNIDVVLKTAAQLKDRSVDFHFVGDGGKAEEIRRAAATAPNIKLFPFVERDLLATSLAACDAGLVSLPAQVEGLAVPSRAYNYLALGRPILGIFSGDTDIGRLCRTYQCGLITPPHIERVLDAISVLREPAERARMSSGAARASLAHSANVAIDHYHAAFVRAVQQHSVRA